MILTDVGNIGVHFEGLELNLSPSLYAMSQLGTKKEIVNTFHYVMGGSLAHCLAVIQVCADGDIRDIFGYVDENLMFNEMYASPKEIVILAQSLMKHGIIGDVDRTKERLGKKDYTSEFDAKAFVAAIVAHIGIDEVKAWRMTMTSISSVLRSKFPPPEDESADKFPSLERVGEVNEWLKKVNEARQCKM